MTVFVVIPIYNRAQLLPELTSNLQNQELSDEQKFIFVDSDSPDQSSEFVKSLAAKDSRFHLVPGQSTWWWAQATHFGIVEALKFASVDDVLVLLNDDVSIGSDYLRIGCELVRGNPKTVWGSVLVSGDGTIELGVTAYWRNLSVSGVLASHGDAAIDFEASLISGRGAFYPVEAFRLGARIRTRELPHYLADYDLSSQAKKLGYRLFNSPNLRVASTMEGGAKKSEGRSLVWRAFAKESPSRLASQFHFWKAETGLRNVNLVLRLLRYRVVSLFIQSN